MYKQRGVNISAESNINTVSVIPNPWDLSMLGIVSNRKNICKMSFVLNKVNTKTSRGLTRHLWSQNIY
jgi:hypothetical protein